MKKKLNLIRLKIYKVLLKVPLINIYPSFFYSRLGVQGDKYRISNDIEFVGSLSFLELGSQVEINTGCFLLVKDRITIGENSTLAYQVTILTSANPNGDYNKLALLYPSMKAPVTIGHNSWIGARATILPGVNIGNYCVVAAGSVVTKDVPDYTVVAGVPARIVKRLDSRVFE